MIQRVVTGSSRLRKYVPIGTPISAPTTMMPVALRSACRQALGAKGEDPTKSITSSNAATSFGAAMLLASGMKMRAEPKPENPRAVPEMKAMTQIASATLRVTPSGIRLVRLISVVRPARSSAQAAAGLLGHLGHDVGGDRVDLLVGHRLLARLD